MVDSKFLFIYCQKLIIFSKDWEKVFLARRAGEADYNKTFSFIGGRMETTDPGIIESLRREKIEEVGADMRLRVYPLITRNIFYVRKDKARMILPHYIAHYADGDIKLNQEEYSEFRWVSIDELPSLHPKVENIPELVDWAKNLRRSFKPEDYLEI